MKSYVITVNGVPYNVTVQEQSQQSQPIQPVPTPTATTPVAPPPAPTASSSADTPVVSPLPGTIIDFKVKVGDVIEKNALIAIVESMKMENEIVSPHAGKVTSLVASKGANISAGDTLITVAQ